MFLKQKPDDSCIHVTDAAAESVMNTAVDFDIKSGEKIQELFSSYLVRAYHGIAGCSDLFPNDKAMQIVLYALPAIRGIIQSPHSKMIRESEMVSQSHLREISNRTVTWISRRPGRNVREKIANSPHILSEKKLFTADTPENNALSFLLTRLYDILSERLALAESEEPLESETIRSKLCEFFRVYRAFRRSELSEISRQCPAQANNVLLGDKNYKKIWRSIRLYKLLVSQKIPEAGEVMKKYAAAVTIMTQARLNALHDMELCDGFCSVEELTDGKTVRFVVYSDDKEMRELAVSLKDCSIRCVSRVLSYNKNWSRFYTGIINQYLSFDMTPDAVGTTQGRGIPFLLISDNVNEHLYADLAALDETVGIIVGAIRKLVVLSTGEYEEDYKAAQGDVCIDFTTFDCVSLDDTLVSANIIGSSPVIADDHCVYALDTAKPVPLSLLMDTTGETNGVSLLLDKFAQFTEGHTFTYLVPDNVDEFEQKIIRRQIGAKITGKQSYPVWRSVAAAEGARLRYPGRFNGNPKWMVVDTPSENCPVTELHILKNGCFERYVPFSAVDDQNSLLPSDNMAKEYLRRFIQKYVEDGVISEECFDRIVHTGKINRFLEQPSDWMNDIKVLLSAEPDMNFLNIFYDEDIMNDIVDKAFAELEKVVSDERFIGKWMLIICNSHILAERIINTRPQFLVVPSRELLVGAEDFCRRRNNGEDIWKEHLPRLQFMLPANGRYCLLTLIDNKSVDAAKAEYRMQVEEPMVLPAGKQQYKFPLIKDNYGRMNRFVGVISDPSFPLAEDTTVHMEVIYRYGSEDTYELVLRAEGDNPPFREIRADWENMTYEIKADAEISVPAPKIKSDLYTLTNATIKSVGEGLNMAYNRNPRFNAERLKISMFHLLGNIRDVNIDSMLTDNEKALDAAGEFLEKLSQRYLKLIDDGSEDEAPIDALQPVWKDIRQTMLYTLAQVASSFETMFDERFAEYDLESLSRDSKICSFMFMHYLTFNGDMAVWDHYMDFFRNCDYSLKFSIMRSMSVMFWTNPDTLELVYNNYPDIIDDFLSLIKAKTDHQKFAPVHSKGGENAVDYSALLEMRDVLETLLAILRLRTKAPEKFTRLRTGSEEAVLLAEQIKLIDKKLYDCGNVLFAKSNETKNVLSEFKKRSRVNLEVSAPPALRGMSRLCYALVVYLTGELGADSIRILNFDADK